MGLVTVRIRFRVPLLAALALVAPSASAQISPGPLAQAHASLEGASGCLRCHAPNKGLAPDRCLSCHIALKERITAGHGLHARAEYRKCETCHIEHQGRAVDLRWWGPKGIASFNHLDAGFALEGKHAGLECVRCHKAERVLDPAALSRGGGNPERTYLGLGTACVSCHADIHRGQFGNKACVACHTMDTFKISGGFNHAQTRYPLTGRHTTVACEKCHPAANSGDGTGRVFTGIAFASCSNCHTDPHRGRFGATCASCHTPSAWTNILKTSKFNHSQTAFPLLGGHRAVACDNCHRGRLTGKLKHQRCSDCHADNHRGEFKTRPDRGACESCHDVEAFSPARFSLEDHQKSAHHLEGAHRAVACDQCHRRAPGQKTAAYRMAFGKCSDCHKDPHLGSMDRYAGLKGCATCHGMESWRTSSFDHSVTRFPLTLGHASVACAACHTSAAGGPKGRPSFTGLSPACASCHRDIHAGQFAREGKTGCERCHTGPSWKPASGFDHGRDSAYRLDGAHFKAPCGSCHRAETLAGVTVVRYKPLGKACVGCHGGKKS